MDPNAAPGGLYGWILQYGQVAGWVAQIVYWLGMLLLVGYAVWQYKRWVNFQLGVGRSGKLRNPEAEEDAPVAKKSSKKVSVEEFVD